MVLFLTLSGCSSQSGSGEYDHALAKQQLEVALDAWKTGQVAALAKRQPRLRFVDEDYMAGYHLINYSWKDSEAILRPHQPIEVVLQLRARDGKTTTRQALFQVHLDAQYTVMRTE